jgi:hypothetical protein
MPTAPQLVESGVTASASKVQGEGALQRIQSDIQRYMDGKISAQNAALFQAPKWRSPTKASFHCHDVVIHNCDDVMISDRRGLFAGACRSKCRASSGWARFSSVKRSSQEPRPRRMPPRPKPQKQASPSVYSPAPKPSMAERPRQTRGR